MKQAETRVEIPSCFCGFKEWAPLFHYDAPPEGETAFVSLAMAYRRDILQCRRCGHCRSLHDLPLEQLYSEEYVSATYGNTMRKTYEMIMSLPPEQSDNVARVGRITSILGHGRGRQVLDVGSGLCVFLARMKEAGWKGWAVDPDERAVAQARDVVGVQATHADWRVAELGDEQFDLITFNKVLEHIEDPRPFLVKARQHLCPDGHVYIEVPDGKVAVAGGPARQEFFIEHWHVFSPLSLLHLILASGFILRFLERVHEPSGKYTLRAIVTNQVE